jgi:serine/threonine protein kinase
VAYLHSHEPVVIHGDIKPVGVQKISHIVLTHQHGHYSQTNVLVDDDGRAKVCDFGLTGVFSEGMSDYTTPINSSTMRYLANELIVAEEPAIATKASDVWAVGCLGLEVRLIIESFSTNNIILYYIFLMGSTDILYSWYSLRRHTRIA